ncbi:hypothetical protein OEA41_001027 [Lepraria neglecta]|uniref:Uncharacterized protein n=1 Tax=Lepraria neglecta TaxID=209136 RepID=A0AAD9ZHL8_9LECA|nr:hypothetical protein OEA41_001027 [Lepraria neglecta]
MKVAQDKASMKAGSMPLRQESSRTHIDPDEMRSLTVDEIGLSDGIEFRSPRERYHISSLYIPLLDRTAMLDYFTTSLRDEFRASKFLRLPRKPLGIMPGQPDNFVPPLRIKVAETTCCLPDGPVISLKKKSSNHPARSPGRRLDGRPLCDAHQDYIWGSGIQLEELAISEIKMVGRDAEGTLEGRKFVDIGSVPLPGIVAL